MKVSTDVEAMGGLAADAEDVMVMYWYMIDDPSYMIFYRLDAIAAHVGNRRRFEGKKIQVKYGTQVLHERTPDKL